MQKNISYSELVQLEDAFDKYVKKTKACLSNAERSESLNDFVCTYRDTDEFASVEDFEAAVLNGGAWDFKCDTKEPAGDPYAKAEEMERNGSGEVQENGYKFKTTFWSDFSIADRFGLDAVQDTFNRAFAEWKSNVIYLTELVLVLNWKIYYFDGGSKQMKAKADEAQKEYLKVLENASKSKSETELGARADAVIRCQMEKEQYLKKAKYFEDLAVLYDKLWKQADEYACEYLKGRELGYFYDVTD